MALERKRSLHFDVETTYGSDPSSNGSGYTAIPCTGLIGDLVDGKQPVPTEYQTGRNYPSAPIAGPDGGSFRFAVPLIGLATAAGDGGSPPSADWLDGLLTHIFGSSRDIDGEQIDTVNSATDIDVNAGDPWNIQDLVAVYEASIPAANPRTQWQLVSADNGTQNYELAPGFTANPTGGSGTIGYGSRAYRHSGEGGDTLAFVYTEDDLEYLLLGNRVTSARIVGELDGFFRLETEWAFDSKTVEGTSKASQSLPAASSGPAVTPLMVQSSPVWVGTTNYCTRRIEIDLGIESAVQGCTSGANGRAGHTMVSFRPRVTLELLRLNAVEELRRNATKQRMLIQMGGGVLSGGVLNTMAFHLEECVMVDDARSSEGGRQRQTVTFEATDKVTFSGSTDAVFAALARA